MGARSVQKPVWIMKSSMAAPMEAPTAAIFRYQPANLMIWFGPSESSRAGWPERAEVTASQRLRVRLFGEQDRMECSIPDFKNGMALSLCLVGGTEWLHFLFGWKDEH